MAIGDAADAAGMGLVPGTLPADQIDTEINRTRDYIAERASRAGIRIFDTETEPVAPQVGDLWAGPL